MIKVMRKFALIICTFSFLLIGYPVEAASNPYGKTENLYGDTTVRCTWYAWQQAYENTGVALPGWGNAQTWYDSAAKSGYSVGKTAKAKSIVVWSSADGYGHVGYVTKVEGNKMTTNEAGLLSTEPVYCEDDPSKICEYTYKALNGDGIKDGIIRSTDNDNIIGYIYLDEAIKTTKKVTTSNNSSSEASSKSNNNYLSNLSIDVQAISFDKDTTEYSIEVPYETKVITISAEAEETKALVTGTGAKALKVGTNSYVISVTAENGGVREYNIIINRLEREISNVTEENNEETQERSTNIMWYIIILGIFVIVVILSLILFLKRRHLTNK